MKKSLLAHLEGNTYTSARVRHTGRPRSGGGIFALQVLGGKDEHVPCQSCVFELVKTQSVSNTIKMAVVERTFPFWSFLLKACATSC